MYPQRLHFAPGGREAGKRSPQTDLPRANSHSVEGFWKPETAAAREDGTSAFEFAHLRDPAFRARLVDFDGVEIRRASGQAVGCRAKSKKSAIRSPFGVLSRASIQAISTD
jgi:hypothetical protein